MPTKPAFSSPEALLESHENRLKSIEDDVGELSNDITSNTLKIQHLEEKIQDATDRILEKIELTFSPFSERVAEHFEEDRKLAETIYSVDDRLRLIENSEKTSKDRNSKIRAGLWAVVIGGLAIVFKEIVMAVWQKF